LAGLVCGCRGAAVIKDTSSGSGGGSGTATIVVPSALAHNVDSIL
jgi:hypothetical protein